MLVTLGAALAANEAPGMKALAGILLVSIGIISLAFRGRRLPETGIFYALGTGFFIAAYSVTDGIGGRLSGHPAGYTLWMCLLWGATAVPVYVASPARLAAVARRRSGPAALLHWAGSSRCLLTALSFSP